MAASNFLINQTNQSNAAKERNKLDAAAEALKRMRESQARQKTIKDAQIKAEQSGLTGEYGPISEASYQNADGSWTRPQYQTILDPTTGLLKDVYRLDNTLDTRGLDKFRDEALRDAGVESAWLKMAMDAEKLNRLDQHSNLGAQLNASQRAGFDALASQGGLDSGSRMSLARSSLKDFMRGKQDINNQANKNVLGLRTTDEENRIQMLSHLPGMELQKSQFDADIQGRNAEAALKERQYAYDQEMDAWKKNQEVWGANKQAEAQRSASGGCFEKGTLVTMADGSQKPIEEVELGDETLLGGKVLQCLQGLSKKGDDWYEINGAIVSGSHLILSDERWIQCRDYEGSEEVLRPSRYYNLTTEKHFLWINETLFSDMQDVDNYELDDLSAKAAKNDQWFDAERAIV